MIHDKNSERLPTSCCRAFEYVLSSAAFGISLNATQGAYVLAGKENPDAFCVLRWCPFCGVFLGTSDSMANGMFRDAADEILKATTSLTTIGEVISMLGSPDETRSPVCESNRWDPWVRAHYYHSLYEGFSLIVNEYEDGTIRRIVKRATATKSG